MAKHTEECTVDDSDGENLSCSVSPLNIRSSELTSREADLTQDISYLNDTSELTLSELGAVPKESINEDGVLTQSLRQLFTQVRERE